MSVLLDLMGQQYGRLKVIKRSENKNGRVAWLCKCDCGNETIVTSNSLRRGDTISCGCYRRENPNNLIDLNGMKFNRLKVIRREGSIEGQASWLCVCDCGSELTVKSRDLRDGLVCSCGCYRSEYAKERATIHGGSYTNLYAVWNMMKQRCNNGNNKDFKYYGKRGIKVCSSWLDFKVFRKWALSNGYKEGLSIERVDNDGNYCPENCKWIPLEHQNRNTRRSIKNSNV